jgi:hypothetical protein
MYEMISTSVALNDEPLCDRPRVAIHVKMPDVGRRLIEIADVLSEHQVSWPDSGYDESKLMASTLRSR